MVPGTWYQVLVASIRISEMLRVTHKNTTQYKPEVTLLVRKTQDNTIKMNALPTDRTIQTNNNPMGTSSYRSPIDLGGQLSNDSVEITQRARQDLIENSRLVCPRLASPYNGGHSEMVFSSTKLSTDSDKVSPSRFKSVPKSLPFDHSMPSMTKIAQPPTKKSRVDFGTSKVINEGPKEIISEEEAVQRWWMADDLEVIKQRAKDTSIRLRQQATERGGCFVELAHKKTTLMLANNFPELIKLPPSSPDQDLKKWCARSDGRRGLERFASRNYGIARRDDVTEAREAVIWEQRRQQQEGKINRETLAQVSKGKSRRARTFALFMGEADAQAARAAYSSKQSKKVLATA